MSILIALMTFWIFLFSGIFAKADVLLLPEQNVAFTTYREACEKPGYKCTDTYFYEQINQKETPHFDELINAIDLASNVYVQAFAKNLAQVLQKEMLSEDQLEMAIRLTSQVKEQINNKSQISLLETELKQTKEVLERAPLVAVAESFVIFFKRKISTSDFKKIKPVLTQFPVVYFNFSSIPLESATRQKVLVTPEAILTGECESARLNPLLNITSWQPLAASRCSLTESFSVATQSVGTSLVENKKWWITGAVVIGAAILLNQYEVQFQF